MLGLTVVFPLIVLVTYVVMETSQAYMISQAMNQAAYLAAKGLANYYQTNPEVISNTIEQQNIFSAIRFTNLISSNNQFQIAGWNTSNNPGTVTVTVTYLSGQGSPPLPSFPNPDPLNLSSVFTISSSSTCALVQ